MKSKAKKIKAKKKRVTPFFASRGSSGFFKIQHKLTVGKPGDKYETEADNIADKVVARTENANQGLNSSAEPSSIQQKTDQSVQEKPLAETVTPIIQSKEEVEEKIQGQSHTKEGDEPENLATEKEEENLQAKSDDTEKEEPVQMSVEKEEEQVQAQSGEGKEEEELAQAQSEEKEEEEPVQAQSEGKEEEEPVQMSAEKENEEEKVQAKSEGGSTVTPSTETKLSNSKSAGRKLDTSTQKTMETAFGADFSDVNIHTDADAVQMNRQLGAQAFTHGKDVYFNKGKYNPETDSGKHLLAHELTHTIQQTGMIPNKLQLTIGDRRDLNSARFSGNLVLEACLDNEQTLRQGSSGDAVTLIQQALIDAGFPLPQFGADGIFGAETRSALQDFQRASSLTADGILGQNTMSSLDALFSGGAPALPPAVPVIPQPTAAPTVTTETILHAPDGSPATRTTVGVGERVRFTADTTGTWTVTDGRIIGLNTGSNMVWEAPAVASNPTITITTSGGIRSVPFTVIAPNDLSMVVATHDAIPVGTAGACMITNVTVNPLNVSFGRTQWLEVPGPATNVAGYFTRFSAANLRHRPTDHYLTFNDNNTGLIDHAFMHNAPPPISFGTFDWVIPNRYKIDGESDSQGRFFTNTLQAFLILDDGTVSIDKAGDFVVRTIDNVVT